MLTGIFIFLKSHLKGNTDVYKRQDVLNNYLYNMTMSKHISERVLGNFILTSNILLHHDALTQIKLQIGQCLYNKTIIISLIRVSF